MYQSHFGLTKGLFSDGIALDTAVYSSPRYDRVIANFKVALTSPSSVIVLTGPAGVGKTTLTSTALRASSTRLAIAWLNGTPTNASELLELLLIELGIATLRTTRIERLQLWRQFQGEMRATASRLFVVAERTEDLSAEVLRALDSLTSPDAGGNPGANVVLLGQPGLERHLAASALDSLRQRIRAKAQLEPFTEAELTDYLRHQVAGAGGRFDAIFAPGVVAALYRYSGGVARLANNLCETALTLAASQLEKSLSLATLTNAASLLGLVEAAPVAVAVEPKPATVAVEPKPAAVAPKAPETREPIVRLPPTPATPTPAPTPPVTTRIEVKPAAPIAPPAVAPRASVPPPAPAAATPPVARTAPTPPAAAPAPTPAAPPPAAVAPAATRAPTPPFEIEFDGEATDITDVSISDFPVLTDAIDIAETPAPTLAARPAPQPSPSRPAAAVAPPAAPADVRPAASAPAAARPGPAAATPATAPAPAAPVKRVETAYTATQPGTSSRLAAPTQASKPAAPAPAVAPPVATAPAAAKATPAAAPSAPPKPTGSDEQDLARQTQTMRAISVAKSINDVSDSMAETLFGDAELDLLTAALASNWDDDQAATDTAKPEAKTAPPKPAPTPAPKPAPAAKPAAAKPASSSDDDLLDLLGLSDAPLELIDDSTLPPTAPSHKTAAQR